MNKFWNWVRNSDESRTLYLNGTIAEESWFDDDITPAAFKAELLAGEGDITVWINSPGGDCVAASQIYSISETMVSLGREMGRETIAVITDMSQPLGRAIGTVLKFLKLLKSCKVRAVQTLQSSFVD